MSLLNLTCVEAGSYAINAKMLDDEGETELLSVGSVVEFDLPKGVVPGLAGVVNMEHSIRIAFWDESVASQFVVGQQYVLDIKPA